MRIDNDPSAQLDETLQATLFAHHPYGTPIIGWNHEIEELSREDALAYYTRFYTPENAILIVAGDVDARDVEALAAQTYGKIPARARGAVAPSPAGAAAARRAAGHARGREGRAALARAHLRRALLHHGRAGRGRGARRSRAYAWRRPRQRALRNARRRGEARGLRRRLLHGLGARRHALLGLRDAGAEGVALEELDIALDRVLAKFIDDEDQRGRFAARQDAADRRRGLCADSQVSLARWYGEALGHWPRRRGRRRLARPHRRGHGRRRSPRPRANGWTRSVPSPAFCCRRKRPTPKPLSRLAALADWNPLMTAHNTLATPKSRAENVQRVVTPGGVEAWLVESYAVPLVALEFSARGGAAQDPAGKAGLATLLAGLLDEGAGPHDARAFHRAVEDLADPYRLWRRSRFAVGSFADAVAQCRSGLRAAQAGVERRALRRGRDRARARAARRRHQARRQRPRRDGRQGVSRGGLSGPSLRPPDARRTRHAASG